MSHAKPARSPDRRTLLGILTRTVPTARDAGQDRRDRRHRVRREARFRHRRGLAAEFPPAARREYPAYGLPYLDFPDAVRSLAEACTAIRRLWSEAEPFDFEGTYHQLAGAFCNPKPRPAASPADHDRRAHHRDAARGRRHVDLWNIPGGDIDDCVRRSALLDQCCAEIGRDPASIIRSIHVRVSYDQPSKTRDSIAEAIDAGFRHIVLGLPAPISGRRRALGRQRARQHLDLICRDLTWAYRRFTGRSLRPAPSHDLPGSWVGEAPR